MLFSDTFDNFKDIQGAASHVMKLAESPDYSEPVEDYFKATDDTNDGTNTNELDMETYIEPSQMNSKTGNLCVCGSLLIYYMSVSVLSNVFLYLYLSIVSDGSLTE